MTCPICDRAVVMAFKPFCSKRCADVDLSKWLSGSYAILSANAEEEDELYQQLSATENKPH
ncbi:MAG: DNA gyrase inhibitor YacG [Yoonia sp.]|nr:DNA gyrase inhibitor YacG [Yoonia sp.]